MAQQQQLARLLDLTIPVETTDLTQKLRVSGKVQAIRQVNVSPREAGRLQALYVDQGDQVQQGQLLARMDYGDLKGGIQQAQGRIAELEFRLAELKAGERSQTLAASEARVAAQQSRVELLQTEVQRLSVLAERGAISQNEWDSKQASLKQAEADLRASQKELELLQSGTRPEVIQQMQAQLIQARGQLRQQESREKDTAVIAPFSGIVLQRFADVGAFVTPTTSASEATAASSSSILSLAQGIEIQADVPEAQLGTIQLDQAVEIRSAAFPDQVISGRVKRISPATVVVREVTIFRVTIEPDPGSNLRIGMNVSVDFLGDPLPNVVTVPTVAVIYQEGKEGVIVWDPTTAKPMYRQVQTGITQVGLTQIVSGLNPGERIFTALPPGTTLDALLKSKSSPTAP
jgi:HlyD family secretion protein